MISLKAEHVYRVYECLRAFSPWAGLRLPKADEVEFWVSGRRDIDGEYSRWLDTGTPIIVISEKRVGHFDTLAMTVGHEMIHLYQDRAKTDTRAQHNAEFNRIARRACRAMGWDYKQF